jgi:hypothetical protein
MLEMLEEMGWIVVEVEELRAKASIVRGIGVILMRPGASPEIIAEVVDRVLMGQPEGRGAEPSRVGRRRRRCHPRPS